MTVNTILITGASSGIGAALARAYAGPQTRLVLWGRTRARLDEVAAACRDRGSSVETACFDLTDFDALLRHLESADDDGGIELAIFNAGLGGSVAPALAAQPVASAREMAAVNFTAPVLGANVIAGRMAARGRGRIVLVGSVAGVFPLPMAPVYSGTKAGLAMFAESLGLRLSGSGVGITLVSPGFIDTPMSQSLTEPKPFLIGADQAARVIMRGIARGRREIVVPWQFRIVRLAAGLVPRALVRQVLSAVLRASRGK